MQRPVAELDTNAVLRYLLGDDPEQTAQAVELIEGAPAGSLFLHTLIVAEVVWFFRSYAKVPRSEIALSIQRLLENESIVTDPELPDAIIRYATANIDFADCVLAARAAAMGRTVASFDRDYRKFDDMKAKSPRQLLVDILAALP